MFLYFIYSDKEYQKLIEFSAIDRDIFGITYLVFREDIHSKDGRVFRAHNDILVAVVFISHFSNVEVIMLKMVNYGLDLDLLVSYYDLTFDLDETDDERVRRIVLEEELIEFLNKLGYRFNDDSILSMSNVEKGILDLKQRLRVHGREIE